MLRYGCTRLEVSPCFALSRSSYTRSMLTKLPHPSQIGVQSVYEDVARDTNRGHTVQATCESFHLAKDAGFKVVSHMMVRSLLNCRFSRRLCYHIAHLMRVFIQPDLPNVGVERDMEQFLEYFENPAFRSDGLKIYPTLVIRGTGLYELWRTGRYVFFMRSGSSTWADQGFLFTISAGTRITLQMLWSTSLLES